MIAAGTLVANATGKSYRCSWLITLFFERVSDVSVMPERLLEQLAPQQLRDLISYLQGNAP